MEMIAHKAKCQYDNVETQDNYCNVIHALNKIFTVLKMSFFSRPWLDT